MYVFVDVQVYIQSCFPSYAAFCTNALPQLELNNAYRGCQ